MKDAKDIKNREAEKVVGYGTENIEHGAHDSTPAVSIVILNWNGWKDTLECLESLCRISYNNYSVIVVDNGSTDDSFSKIIEFAERGLSHHRISLDIIVIDEEEAKFGRGSKHPASDKEFILIKNHKNYGFAGGNNVGISYALKSLNPKYILLLNNDTTASRSFLKELVDAMETDENIGSVQSLLLRPGGKIIDSLGQEMSKMGSSDAGFGMPYIEGSLMDKSEIFGPCAAAALYRSDMLKEIGLFDDDFFVIYEDVDLSWRMRLRGYSSFLISKSVIHHKRGISGTKFSGEGDLRRYYLYKNWWLIALRYYPLFDLISMPEILFRNALRCTSDARKLGKLGQILGQVYRSLKLRRRWSRELPSALKEVRSRWMLPY
jgi:GT2 family glycosyltransferase